MLQGETPAFLWLKWPIGGKIAETTHFIMINKSKEDIMTWIEEAKAEVERRKIEKERTAVQQEMEEIESRLKYEEYKLRAKTLFCQSAQPSLGEIEKVLLQATRQGLIVYPKYGHVRNGEGDFLLDVSYEDVGYEASNIVSVISVYNVTWTITLETGHGNREMRLVLGLKTSGENKDIFIPTTTAPEVEKKIKEWLVKIFSEPKDLWKPVAKKKPKGFWERLFS